MAGARGCTTDKRRASPPGRDPGRLEVLVEEDVPEHGCCHPKERHWQRDEEQDVDHGHCFEARPHAKLKRDSFGNGNFQALPEGFVLEQCFHNHLQFKLQSCQRSCLLSSWGSRSCPYLLSGRMLLYDDERCVYYSTSSEASHCLHACSVKDLVGSAMPKSGMKSKPESRHACMRSHELP